MADDNFFHTKLRAVSQSYAFQQFLRLNPRVARRALRGREQIALEFVEQQGARLFPPVDPIPQPVPPPPPPPPPPAPVKYQRTCEQTFNFQMGPGTGQPPVIFNFAPGLGGNAYLVEVEITDPTSDLIVWLRELTDNCSIYVAKPGTPIFDTNPINYFSVPFSPGGDAPGYSEEVMLVENEVVADIMTQSQEPGVQLGPYVVLYHRGNFPFVYGTAEFLCGVLPAQVSLVPNTAVTLTLPAYTPNPDSSLPGPYFEFGAYALFGRSVLLSFVSALSGAVVLTVTPTSFRPFSVYIGNLGLLPRDPRVSSYTMLGRSAGNSLEVTFTATVGVPVYLAVHNMDPEQALTFSIMAAMLRKNGPFPGIRIVERNI